MNRWTVRTKQTHALGVVTVVVFAVGVLVAGCASTAPKEPPPPSPPQVRSNADRTFEKLKQEERERKVDSPAVSK